MLGLYRRVVGHIWRSPDPEGSRDPPSDAITSAPKGDVQLRFLTGVVTSITADGGMINEYVYFEMGVVMGGIRAEVGDVVHVEAKRTHSKGGWRASRVDVTSQWDPDAGSKEEVLVGFVSGMGGGRGVACCDDQEVSFPSDVVTSISGYHPHVNDWVKIFLLHQDGMVTVNDVQALREQSVAGTITSMAQGYGTILQDIHFTLSACPRGYYPSKGQRVKAECVEYKHHRNNWRAYRVVPEMGMESRNKLESIPAKTVCIPRPVVPLLSSNGKVSVGHVTSALAAPLSNEKACPGHVTAVDQSDFALLPSADPPVRSSVGVRGSYHDKLSACRIPGQRPVYVGVAKMSTKLRGFPVPEELRECIEEEGDVVTLEPTLEEPICMDNFRRRLSVLLFLEEIQRERDIRQFDMATVDLKRCGPYLSLEVPGLAEGRPSLLMGDRAIVCPPGGDDTCIHWEGFIHEVRGRDVLLKFADSFHETFDNEAYDVMFTFSRTQFRRQHHVVELGDLIGPDTLFPRKPAITPPRAHPERWFNPALNTRQKAAVYRILGSQCSPAPYVVFGPPGTGKTVTLVEAVLQIHCLVRGSRVLVCAPSNSAADLLAERISESGPHLAPGQLIRLNAIQRPHSIPPSITRFCKDTNSADSAVRSRIVIATCSTAGSLHGLGLGVGHFSHVIVDEAGQATEPECLLPVSLLARSKGQVVLAGDPCQLGPVLSSHLAGGCGLGLSLLDRLMGRHAYQRDEEKFGNHGNYDPLLVTKLVHNYRSHQHLLLPYSKLFYDCELEVCAPPLKTDLLLEWEGLPQKGFPLVFHGVVGEDLQEGNSPSWYNPVEALQVVKYVQALKDNETFAPRLAELGVVTPYRKQAEKIRLVLQQLGCCEGGGAKVKVGGVKVGSVEEFQGQEKTAIIISTVRSSAELVDMDERHHLGFIGNPKRFNVAISRACALLVVVGNPHLLSKDPYWSELLDYAVKNHAYIGCQLPSQQ